MKLSLLLIASGALLAQHNPVLSGDVPDPSVIRVGNEYWATATTSHWAPVFPLFRSVDLKTWTREGAVFAQRPAWADINFWAPEIAEHKGRFFVYYTARKRGGPLCVAVATASSPRGPWQDHGPMVCEDVGSIDAVPVTGDDGQRWLVWKNDGNSKRLPTPLWAQRLDPSGTALVGERKEILRNDQPWEGQLVEGPFLLKRNGWWYLFYSGAGCCGVQCNYALGVARSKSLLGPYEKYAGNPILKGNDAWKCPGHGSIVSDAQGRTWLLYHAYEPKQSVFVGRQGLLDEVVWGKDGWPSIAGPSAGSAPRTSVHDRFTNALDPAWSWPVSQTAAVEVRDGVLSLRPEADEAVVAQSPVSTEYTAEATLRLSEQEGQSGLAGWGNQRNALGLSVDREGNLSLWRRQNGTASVLARSKIKVTAVHLRMTVTGGGTFAFFWSDDATRWNPVTPALDGGHLPPWDLATRVALYASGAGKIARFRGFRLH